MELQSTYGLKYYEEPESRYDHLGKRLFPRFPEVCVSDSDDDGMDHDEVWLY